MNGADSHIQHHSAGISTALPPFTLPLWLRGETEEGERWGRREDAMEEEEEEGVGGGRSEEGARSDERAAAAAAAEPALATQSLTGLFIVQ